MGETGAKAERQCGDCKVCCVLFEIQSPTLNKPAGQPCQHLDHNNHGCSIYQWRPQPCVAFNCLWLQSPNLPDHWRPDRSSMLMYLVPNTAPGYDGQAVVISLANGLSHLEDQALLGFILSMVQEHSPVYLGVHKHGRADNKAYFLNPPLEQAVMAGDREKFVAILRQAIAQKLGLNA